MAEDTNLGSEAAEPIVNDSGATAAADLKLLEWRMIGDTVRGNSHLRDGRPNQDAILQVRESGVSPPLILSISDGHGSDKCFRSDRGSRLAVTMGTALLRELTNEKQKNYDAAKVENAVKKAFPVEFIRRWQEAVESDLKGEPFTKEELEQVEAKDSIQAREIVESHPLLAYGATTLTVAVTDSLIIYAQLGDGEILCVSETGEVSKPLPEDERLFANETTSLCTDHAVQDFRIACQPFSQSLPALIVITTDGYANSFSDDAGFFKVGSDLLTMLRTDGFETVNRSVKGWLEDATRLGSGDDCTLGIIYRTEMSQGGTNSPVIADKEGSPPQAPTQEIEAETIPQADPDSPEKS